MTTPTPTLLLDAKLVSTEKDASKPTPAAVSPPTLQTPKCPPVPDDWKDWSPPLCEQWMVLNPFVRQSIWNALKEKRDMRNIMFTWWDGEWLFIKDPVAGFDKSINMTANHDGITVNVYFCYD